MTNAKNILKSLAMAGVEWELESRDTKHEIRNTVAEFRAPKPAAPMSAVGIMEIALRLAASPDLVGGIRAFAGHPLYAGAKNTVVPAGIRPSVRLLVVTDIPSLSDDSTGIILSGPEGELFDKMIAAIGLSRADVAVTPLVFWRPAGGRTPTADELKFCRPFVDRIIKETLPKKILLLGSLAAKEIAGANLPRDHGKQIENMIPIYKPEFIIQNPAVKKEVWTALKLVIS